MTRDLRRYASQTNTRLVLGFLLLVFLVGIGLIYIFYGSGAALMGIACLISGLSPGIVIILALLLIDWSVKRYRERS